MKKVKEQSDRERQELEDRERGFNLYLSGANHQRVTEQNKKNKAKDASRLVKASDEVIRRKWQAPNSASSKGKPSDDQYMNPFETHSDSFLARKMEPSELIAEPAKNRK